MNLLMTMLLRQAFPVWERYKGKVPQQELRNLEIAGDWPRGWGAILIEILNRNKALRRQLRELFANGYL